jgi:hypothetical protein
MEDGKKAGQSASKLGIRQGERPANRQAAKKLRQNRLDEEQENAQDDIHLSLSRPSSPGQEVGGALDERRRATEDK